MFTKILYTYVHFEKKKAIVLFLKVTELLIIIYYILKKSKIENNSTWEGAFYQSEWDEINWSWVILIFSLYVCCC